MQTNLQKPKQQKANKQDQQQTAELTFLEHIHELRSRIFWVVATIILVSAAGFQFKDQLIATVMAPLDGQKLVYLTPGGGFSFIFTLCIYFGVLFAIPVIVYHIYRFLQPLLKRASRRLLMSFITLSSLLALTGALFGYFVTIPAALDFLATFAGDAVTPNLTADSYLSFVVAYIVGLALLFQLPLLLYIFDHVKPFPPGSLLSSQRFVIIGATVVAAIITPTPDVVNMAIVAVPIVAMYQLGVVAVFVRHRMVLRAIASAAVQERTEDMSVIGNENVPEEPLTAIIEEINGEERVSEQPMIIAPKETPVAQQATTSVKAVPSMHQKAFGRRSVDGIVRSVPGAPPRSQLRQDYRARRQRSVDGFTFVTR